MRTKPAPDLFLAAARALALEPQDCVVFEDAPAGITAAVAAGMRAVAVKDPDVPAELYTAAGACQVVDSLTEVDLAALGLPPMEK
jgi:beta-phosphoglucomutase-like phosphatase (HAD superfamily)